MRRLLRPRLNQSGVEIAIPPHPPWPNTIADRALLRQALLNLLSHALDTVHSGAIEVNVSRSDSGLLVTLQESGGYESDSNRHPDSARQGVGLSVARKLIELQGGQLSVDEQRMRWYAQIRLPTQVTKTVLVIDDNESLINLFRRYTGAHQVTVVGTVSSQEAIRLARQIQPHLIVLDLMLPHRDGWEVLERLQQAELVDEIPVVVCSVLREKELALAMGASDYLTKPVSQTGFLELLRRWLGRLQPRPGGSRTR